MFDKRHWLTIYVPTDKLAGSACRPFTKQEAGRWKALQVVLYWQILAFVVAYLTDLAAEDIPGVMFQRSLVPQLGTIVIPRPMPTEMTWMKRILRL